MRSGAWDFHNPVSVRFGVGRLSELPAVIETESVLLVTTTGSTRRGTTVSVTDLLVDHRCTVYDRVDANPSIRSLERAAKTLVTETLAPGRGPTTIVALGGGSTIDSAKVLSLVPAATRRGLSISNLVDAPDSIASIDPLPVIAIPTTAGTGSEVTPFATLWDFDRRIKHSIASPRLYPRAAVLDPALSRSAPRMTTISAGLDAISQGFEAIWNRHATPITTELAGRAIQLGVRNLPRVATNPDDLEGRETMLEASLLSGLAISRTRTALAHAMSYPLTSHYGLPHGLACAITLPALLTFNGFVDDGRLVAIARRFGRESLSELGEILIELLDTLEVNDLLKQAGITGQKLLVVRHEMVHPGRSDNNLRPAGVEQIEQIIRSAGRYLSALRE